MNHAEVDYRDDRFWIDWAQHQPVLGTAVAHLPDGIELHFDPADPKQPLAIAFDDPNTTRDVLTPLLSHDGWEMVEHGLLHPGLALPDLHPSSTAGQYARLALAAWHYRYNPQPIPRAVIALDVAAAAQRTGLHQVRLLDHAITVTDLLQRSTDELLNSAQATEKPEPLATAIRNLVHASATDHQPNSEELQLITNATSARLPDGEPITPLPRSAVDHDLIPPGAQLLSPAETAISWRRQQDQLHISVQPHPYLTADNDDQDLLIVRLIDRHTAQPTISAFLRYDPDHNQFSPDEPLTLQRLPADLRNAADLFARLRPDVYLAYRHLPAKTDDEWRDATGQRLLRASITAARLQQARATLGLPTDLDDALLHAVQAVHTLASTDSWDLLQQAQQLLDGLQRHPSERESGSTPPFLFELVAAASSGTADPFSRYRDTDQLIEEAFEPDDQGAGDAIEPTPRILLEIAVRAIDKMLTGADPRIDEPGMWALRAWEHTSQLAALPEVQSILTSDAPLTDAQQSSLTTVLTGWLLALEHDVPTASVDIDDLRTLLNRLADLHSLHLDRFTPEPLNQPGQRHIIALHERLTILEVQAEADGIVWQASFFTQAKMVGAAADRGDESATEAVWELPLNDRAFVVLRGAPRRPIDALPVLELSWTSTAGGTLLFTIHQPTVNTAIASVTVKVVSAAAIYETVLAWTTRPGHPVEMHGVLTGVPRPAFDDEPIQVEVEGHADSD